MDNLLNPLKAPFSSDAASQTTPARIAIVWALVGLAGGVLLLK